MTETAPGRVAPGIAAGLLLALPVALRGVLGIPAPSAAGALAQPLLALVLLWAAASLVVVPIGLWLGGRRYQHLAGVDRALLLGTALSTLPLALFGGVLRSVTHHRPLGGVTFAVAAGVVVLLCVALAYRMGRGDAEKATWLFRFFSACCWLSLAGTLALAATSAHMLVDFLTLGAACAGAGLLKTPGVIARFPAWALGLAWACLVLGGLVLVRDAQLATDLRARAPISFAALSWLGDGS